MHNKISTIRVGNITVASGYKCEFCGVIRPFDRPDCFCEEYKSNKNNMIKEKINGIKKILKKIFY